MLKFRTLRPSGLKLSAHPSSLLFLAPFHTLRSWVHSFGYSGPHLSSVCHYHPSLLANDFGLLWVLGICAAQRGLDPRERSSQTLEIDFFPLGRESQGLVYPECSLKEGRAWNLRYVCPLDSKVSLPWKESSSQLGRNIAEEQHSRAF